MIFLLALLLFPPCPAEDSSWCTWREPGYAHVALWMRDPAPYVWVGAVN